MRRSAAFTLIEIMIVIAIMGIVMTISVPLVYRITHKQPMNKAITDIVEVCSRARALAILQGTEVDLNIYPKEGRFAIGGASPPPKHEGDPFAELTQPTPPPPPAGAGQGAQISTEHVLIEMCDVNFTEYRDSEWARVRFFPNGTSDELTIILHSDKGEQRGVTLELVTGLASVLNEDDLQKLRAGR